MKPQPAVPAEPARLRHPDRGSGTVLALALGLVLLIAAVLIALLAQAAMMASRAAAAADLAALAAADAARGITDGEPCAIAREVARRHQSRVLSCSEGAGETVQVRTQLDAGTMFGASATGLARAGPPPAETVP
ncbi:secretion/DNA translocation related TadE-like protein [Arthrobacter sp. V4I6]|uniref:Rv3654c family TadE-like protein n=1 Tax=unclassified Arthrobacter TaxID=235627 RepID=UPI0027890B06|nr:MULTISPECIES: Rv3654c family TadE-like protein [unclassified Arthrobacter]MDQ0819705.1 secretion/DNA translocation related TadE-like protein [Arthrobacter sp. V1I7]MDQ0853886.1 secretion/DNA translocation related TadE-like protein [Arthrobacter sp. V4I6]